MNKLVTKILKKPWTLMESVGEVRNIDLRVFENRVLIIFKQKKDEVTGVWKKLHNEELHNLCSSLSIIRMIKSRRMSWAGHVA
jgi:hypothetical protein